MSKIVAHVSTSTALCQHALDAVAVPLSRAASTARKILHRAGTVHDYIGETRRVSQDKEGQI